MKTTCKRCKSDIRKWNFPEDAKLEIGGMVAQDLRLFAINKLMKDFQRGG